MAHAQTGAPIFVHARNLELAHRRTVNTLIASGVHPRSIVLIAANFTEQENPALEVLRAGARIAVTDFGDSVTFTASSRPTDAAVAATIARLLNHPDAALHPSQFLVSLGVHLKIQFRRYGGHGFVHLRDSVLPALSQAGLTPSQIEHMLRAPIDLLAWWTPRELPQVRRGGIIARWR
jgi:predicted metal-dependent phosphotriesterase family hydrolase